MALPSKINRARLEELDPHAITRLKQIIEKGSDKDALVAVEIIYKRIRPAPNSSGVADVAKAAAMGASAGASHLAALTSKAQARMVPAPADVTDVAYSTVHTPTRGEKSE